MASFKKIKLSDVPYNLKDYNCYIVNGNLTEEDVNLINSKNNIILIFSNTKGLNKELIRRLNSNVRISILGGLDYINKNKYKASRYIERTVFTPTSLYKVIEFFEKLESKIRYSWTNQEKCMYVYKTLAEYLHYKYDDEDDYENGKDIVRSLDGLIYGRLVCTGFALVFKEAMDRLGIKCEYQNMQSHHSWNIVEFDGKYYGVDLTWDCDSKGKDNKCNFYYFGRNKKFYDNKHHDISKEKEEIFYNLSEFTIEELKEMYKENNGNVYKKDMESFTDEKGNIIYFSRIKKENNIYKYLVYFDNRLEVISTTIDDHKLLSKENINSALLYNNACIGFIDKSNSEFTKYIRKDGSQFLIKKSKKLENGICELYYIEINRKQNGYEFRRGVLLSEMDLSLSYDVYVRHIIANDLLSKERISKKINYYNGYVGYINTKGQKVYDANFEKDELGIVNRR